MEEESESSPFVLKGNKNKMLPKILSQIYFPIIYFQIIKFNIKNIIFNDTFQYYCEFAVLHFFSSISIFFHLLIFSESPKFPKIDTHIFVTVPERKFPRQIMRDWDDYWDDLQKIEPIKFDQKGGSSITLTNPTNIYVSNSFISETKSEANGGAIYLLATSDHKLLIEETYILSCSAQSQGGGIFMRNGNGILSKVCGISCTAINSRSFSSFDFTSNQQTINKIFLTTVSYCNTIESVNGLTLRHLYGNPVCNSLNSSFNECYRCSALYIQSSSNCQIEISFSSFTNNIATSSRCIESRVASSTTINSCNIISNSQVDTNFGLLYFDSDAEFHNISILGNKGKPIFETKSGQIELIYCTIEDNQFLTKGSPLITSNLDPPQGPFINPVTFFETGYCINNYDRYGTLIGTPNVPTKTKKIRTSNMIIRRPKFKLFLY